jgi:hypothetical protein
MLVRDCSQLRTVATAHRWRAQRPPASSAGACGSRARSEPGGTAAKPRPDLRRPRSGGGECRPPWSPRCGLRPRADCSLESPPASLACEPSPSLLPVGESGDTAVVVVPRGQCLPAASARPPRV